MFVSISVYTPIDVRIVKREYALFAQPFLTFIQAYHLIFMNMSTINVLEIKYFICNDFFKNSKYHKIL